MQFRPAAKSLVTRRSCLRALGGLGAALSLPAMAQGYPSRLIRWIVPYGPGGAMDRVARIVAEPLAEALGQPVIVENKPGAASTIGMRALIGAPADGYTIALVDDATLYNNWHLFADLPYALDDLAYVAMIGQSPLVLLAHHASGVTSFDTFLQWARRNPGAVNYATPGIGTPHHLGAEAINEHYKLRMVPIHYKGVVAAINDLLSGRVQVLFAGSTFGVQFQHDERVVPLAVTSAARLKTLPLVPTLAESGFDFFDATAEIGLVTRGTVPVEVRQRLNEAVNAALRRPQALERLQGIGVLATPNTSAWFDTHVRQRTVAAGALMRRAHIQLTDR